MIQIMTQKYKNKLVFLSVFATVLVVFSVGVYVYANPTILQQSAKFPTTSTTTPRTITPGTGTTTSLTFDAYQRVQGIVGGDNTLPKETHLAIQLYASSTQTAVDYRFEYSQDNRDWYGQTDILILNATSTGVVSGIKNYHLPFASSTVGTSDDTKMLTIIDVPVKARYTRVVFTMAPWPAFPYQPTTTPSFNGAIWTEFIPFKETF